MNQLRAVLLVVVASLLVAPVHVGRSAAQEASPAASPVVGGDDRLYEAIVADERDAVAAETAGRLSTYRIEATLDPGEVIPPDEEALEEAALEAEGVEGEDEDDEDVSTEPQARYEGTLELEFLNTTGRDLDELYFRLYPNDARYGDGALRIRDVRVDDAQVAPALSVGRTVARLPLADPIPDGGTATVTMQFTGIVASTFDFFSSLYNADLFTGTVSLVHWHPILAGYDPETGWVLDPPSLYGDLVFGDAALYDVSIAAPPRVTLVTTGVQVGEDEEVEGNVVRSFVTGPARQFAMTADNDYRSVSAEVGGTTVTSYSSPTNGDAGQRLLDQAVAALELYNELYGAYPYAELDLVELSLGAPTGTEVAHLIALDASLYEEEDVLLELGLSERVVEFIVAQGVANQWWYGVVGTNHYAHPFLDEALAEYSAAYYVEQAYGQAEGERILELVDRALYAYEALITGDQVVDQPGDAFPSSGSYFATVYGKGALALDALRDEIGDEAFLAALRAYADAHRFAIAAPADLRAAFEEASGRDLGAFWTAWFESAATESDIVVETAVEDAATPTP